MCTCIILYPWRVSRSRLCHAWYGRYGLASFYRSPREHSLIRLRVLGVGSLLLLLGDRSDHLRSKTLQILFTSTCIDTATCVSESHVFLVATMAAWTSGLTTMQHLRTTQEEAGPRTNGGVIEWLFDISRAWQQVC